MSKLKTIPGKQLLNLFFFNWRCFWKFYLCTTFIFLETQPTLMLTGPMTTYNAGSTAPPYTNSTSGNSFASSQPGGFPTGPGYSM